MIDSTNYEKPDVKYINEEYVFIWSNETKPAKGFVQHQSQIWQLSQDGFLRPVLIADCCSVTHARVISNKLNFLNKLYEQMENLSHV